MFIWVAVAACALSFCAATGQYLFVRWQHNNDVIAAKQKAADTLTANIRNAQDLIKEVDALVADNALGSVKTNPDDPNTKSVLDALPTTFDPAALATSLQQVVLSGSGVTIDSISVPQELDIPSEDSQQPTPQEMPFSFIVSGSFEQIKTCLIDIERTIRPIKVTSINLSGSDNSLRATVEAVTYYQPSKTVEVGQEVIK
jgi:Tfp pilus assembly protein PilO